LAISQTRRHPIKPDQTLRNRPIHHHLTRTNKHTTTIGTGSRLDGLTGLAGFAVHAGALTGLAFADFAFGGVGLGGMALVSLGFGGLALTGAAALGIGCGSLLADALVAGGAIHGPLAVRGITLANLGAAAHTVIHADLVLVALVLIALIPSGLDTRCIALGGIALGGTAGTGLTL
jgi:hypothetical protein